MCCLCVCNSLFVCVLCLFVCLVFVSCVVGQMCVCVLYVFGVSWVRVWRAFGVFLVCVAGACLVCVFVFVVCL